MRQFPIRRRPPAIDDYAFVPVEGEGVHEIPVGPVHAGIIEPGHFRFSIVGEKVLRLEQHLGYVHKGIERRFTELSLLEGHRLAARVSGDSAVAFSWAYCQALEGMSAARVPPRATWLRALALELERLANHLGDLGALGNDAGFAVGLAQFSRLKEQLLRATEHALGQRYLMDLVVPGGTRVDLSPSGAAGLIACIESIATEVETLRAIYDEHSGLRDRFVGAGMVTPALAGQARTDGIGGARQRPGFRSALRPAVRSLRRSGAEKSRACRGRRCRAGCRAIRRSHRIDPPREPDRRSICRMAVIAGRCPLPRRDPGASVSSRDGADRSCSRSKPATAGKIRRCHPHDPSWQNWPVLEHAIIDNIVPDFPLINKSFNLSYSGHDL